jgi:hypothetical protein
LIPKAIEKFTRRIIRQHHGAFQMLAIQLYDRRIFITVKHNGMTVPEDFAISYAREYFGAANYIRVISEVS